MELIYIRLRNRIHVRPRASVKLKDAARLIGSDGLVGQLEEQHLLNVHDADKNIIIVDLVHIIQLIRSVNPDIEVQTIGPSQTIIEVIYPKKPFSVLSFLAVWFLLFIGAAITIMNFHVDVSMGKVHQQLFSIITGLEDKKPLLIQIPYSFGLGLGMVLFFNHFFQKRFNEEPSPLEVEIFNYQQDLDQYVIMHENSESVRQLDDR